MKIGLCEKKQIKTRFGSMTISQKRPLAIRTGNFGISPYSQELMCYVGQEDIYEKGSEDIEKFLRISSNFSISKD